MNSGIVGALCQNKKGAWYTHIWDQSAGRKIYYQLHSGEEKTITEGVRVGYVISPHQTGAGSPAADKVWLLKDDSHPLQEHRENLRQPEREGGAAWYLPKDTADLLAASSNMPIENTALKIQKYIRRFSDREKNLKVSRGQTFSSTEINLLAELTGNQRKLLAAYKYSYSRTKMLGARMVVGLGGGSVFETSITLHHTYGLPYIPGTALKGCLRSFVVRDLFAGEEGALDDEDFVTIFGTQEGRGGIIFLDAFPTKCDKLEVDIMNPHYADYYQGKCPPTDDMNPVPIKFYAVPEGTQFTFRLASGALDICHCMLRDIPLTDLLETTLTEMGVGAKTAVGYGWLR